MTTCENDPDQSIYLGEFAEDTFLCVVELKDETMLGAAKQILVDNHADDSVPVFANANHVVLMNPNDPTQLAGACCVSHFPDLANNVISVPTFPVVPQQPMPESHRAVQRSMLNNNAQISPDDIIAKLVNSYSQDDVEKYVKWVSTDYQGTNSKITRNSYSISGGLGGCADPTWRCSNNVVDEIEAEIQNILQEYPFDWEVEQVPFRNDMCNNIVVKIRGELMPDEVVIIGAHMDSRNTGSGSTATGPAPGQI